MGRPILASRDQGAAGRARGMVRRASARLLSAADDSDKRCSADCAPLYPPPLAGEGRACEEMKPHPKEPCAARRLEGGQRVAAVHPSFETRPSKSAVADFDTLGCRSRASPTSVGAPQDEVRFIHALVGWVGAAPNLWKYSSMKLVSIPANPVPEGAVMG